MVVWNSLCHLRHGPSHVAMMTETNKKNFVFLTFLKSCHYDFAFTSVYEMGYSKY